MSLNFSHSQVVCFSCKVLNFKKSKNINHDFNFKKVKFRLWLSQLSPAQQQVGM